MGVSWPEGEALIRREGDAPCQVRAADTGVNFGVGEGDGGQLSLAPTPTPAPPPPLPHRCMAPPASPPSSSATSSVLIQHHSLAGLSN